MDTDCERRRLLDLLLARRGGRTIIGGTVPMKPLKVNVVVTEGRVALVLSKRVDWFALSADEARELADELRRRADEVDRQVRESER